MRSQTDYKGASNTSRTQARFWTKKKKKDLVIEDPLKKVGRPAGGEGEADSSLQGEKGGTIFAGGRRGRRGASGGWAAGKKKSHAHGEKEEGCP